MKVNAVIDIPKEDVLGLVTGGFKLSEAIVRSNGKYKDFVDVTITNSNVLLATGITMISTVALFKIYEKIKEKKRNHFIEIPYYVINFNENLSRYLSDTIQGIIDEESLLNLLSNIEELEKNQNNIIYIDLTTNKMKYILNKIFNFTNQLNENIESFKLLYEPSDNNYINLILLKEALLRQKILLSQEN